MVGTTISHHKILSNLGKAWRGVVYKAENLKLTRTAALNFLPHRPHSHELERARFMQDTR